MFKKTANTVKNIFFPAICLTCGRKTTNPYLCPFCKSQIKLLNYPACYTQLKINGINNKKTLTALSSCGYKGPLKNLIHSFKYNHYDYFADFFSQFMLKQLKITKFRPRGYNFIVAVPLHLHKIKKRGYNQAELLAKQLAKYFQLPLKNDIISSKYIRDSQTKLSSKERQENVKGKFIVKKNFRGKNVVLVDDVLTTGATLSTCCQSLKERGINKIYPITLAKTIKN